jgi:hypothetical protein
MPFITPPSNRTSIPKYTLTPHRSSAGNAKATSIDIAKLTKITNIGFAVFVSKKILTHKKSTPTSPTTPPTTSFRNCRNPLPRRIKCTCLL